MKQLNGGHIKKRQRAQLQRTVSSSRAGLWASRGEGARERGRERGGVVQRLSVTEAKNGCTFGTLQNATAQKTNQGKANSRARGGGGRGCCRRAMHRSSNVRRVGKRNSEWGWGDSCSAIKWRARCLIKSQRINRAQLTSNLSLLVSLPLSPLSFSLFHLSPPVRSRVICSAVTDTTLVFQHFL